VDLLGVVLGAVLDSNYFIGTKIQQRIRLIFENGKNCGVVKQHFL